MISNSKPAFTYEDGPASTLAIDEGREKTTIVCECNDINVNNGFIEAIDANDIELDCSWDIYRVGDCSGQGGHRDIGEAVAIPETTCHSFLDRNLQVLIQLQNINRLHCHRYQINNSWVGKRTDKARRISNSVTLGHIDRRAG
jgi:CTP synthase (UTP-ammonia lyase)